MKRIDGNEMAVKVAEEEGKKVNMNIGQIKECMKLTLRYLAKEVDSGNEAGVLELIRRYSE